MIGGNRFPSTISMNNHPKTNQYPLKMPRSPTHFKYIHKNCLLKQTKIPLVYRGSQNDPFSSNLQERKFQLKTEWDSLPYSSQLSHSIKNSCHKIKKESIFKEKRDDQKVYKERDNIAQIQKASDNNKKHSYVLNNLAKSIGSEEQKGQSSSIVRINALKPSKITLKVKNHRQMSTMHNSLISNGLTNDKQKLRYVKNEISYKNIDKSASKVEQVDCYQHEYMLCDFSYNKIKIERQQEDSEIEQQKKIYYQLITSLKQVNINQKQDHHKIKFPQTNSQDKIITQQMLQLQKSKNININNKIHERYYGFVLILLAIFLLIIQCFQ